jgi:KUP system potassium uptake protein
MCVWFAVLAILGISEIVQSPRSCGPVADLRGRLLRRRPGTAFLALGSVVLAVTGAEALYADMGHFGRRAIRRAWFVLVFPALLLNYFGQGALVLDDPGRASTRSTRSFPTGRLLPTIALATAGDGHRLAGRHQRRLLRHPPGRAARVPAARRDPPHVVAEIGQIYVPFVNWALLVGVLVLVIGFRSSTNLASAYGIAVTGTLAIDTLLFFVVVRLLWRKPWWIVIGGATCFLTVDLAFFTANIPKILHGGWFPLVIAAVVFAVLMTWHAGRIRVQRAVQDSEVSIDTFLAQVREMQPIRVPAPRSSSRRRGTARRGPDAQPRPQPRPAQHVVLFTAARAGCRTCPMPSGSTCRRSGRASSA